MVDKIFMEKARNREGGGKRNSLGAELTPTRGVQSQFAKRIEKYLAIDRVENKKKIFR